MSQLESLHERADRLMEQKDFSGAINIYSEILLIEPDDDAAYTNMGQAYMVLGYTERAGNAFNNALHINPDNEVAAFGLKKITDPDFASFSSPAPNPTPPTAEPPLLPKKTETPVNPPAAISKISSNNIDFILNSSLTFNQWSQIALKNANFYNGPIDGKIGSDTKKAIESFQKANGLEIDGLVGPMTWAKLKLFLSKNN